MSHKQRISIDAQKAQHHQAANTRAQGVPLGKFPTVKKKVPMFHDKDLALVCSGLVVLFRHLRKSEP